MKCRICNQETYPIHKAVVLNKYSIQYYHCNNCQFIQTEDPYWINESYSEAIGQEDTGVLLRNINLSRKTAVAINFFFDSNGKFLDYGGGYGILTRLMRDIGFDFYWQDPYCENLTARGFEYSPGIKPIELVTTFESFEHLVDPLMEIEKMMAISRNILFSTELVPKPVPRPEDWWYYSLKSGQHVSLYSIETLQFIAKKFDVNFYSNGKNLHLFSPKKINPLKFKVFLKLTNLGLFSLVKSVTKTKTFEDMDKIVSQSKPKSHEL